MTFASLRARVSSCFASVIDRAISFLFVNDCFSQFACAALLLASSFFKGGGGSIVRASSSRSNHDRDCVARLHSSAISNRFVHDHAVASAHRHQ